MTTRDIFATPGSSKKILSLHICDAGNDRVNNHILEDGCNFKDSCIAFDSKLGFDIHIALAIKKARSLVGYIKRLAKEFNHPYVAKRSYTALVRPSLEYAPLFWLAS